MQSLPLSKRPIDIAFIILFCINFFFITYIVDLEQLVITDAIDHPTPLVSLANAAWFICPILVLSHTLASHGLDLILIARRPEPLAGITRELTQKFGVTVRPLQHLRLLILLLLLLTITTASAQHIDTLHIDTTDGALTISKGRRPLLTYVYKTVYPPPGIDTAYKKSGFIHPLYTPHGQILTRIRPPDHYHHYGIWDPWTHVLFKGDTIDCWNLAARKGTQRFARFTSTSNGPGFAEFSALQQHIVFHKDGSEEVFMDELFRVRIISLDTSYYTLDFKITLTPASPYPVTLLAYRYGGLGWRATAEWNRDNSEVLTSEGKDRRHADNTTARWCLIQGNLGNDYGGVLMLSHPDNYNHPEPLRIWPDTSNSRGDLFANFSPTKDRDWRLEPGHIYTLRYRWGVFNGRFTKENAESTWQSFPRSSALW